MLEQVQEQAEREATPVLSLLPISFPLVFAPVSVYFSYLQAL